MIKRVCGTVVLAGAVLLMFASPGAAQFSLFGGAGATIPTSDYGDYAETGWMVDAGVGIPLGESPFVFVGEGFFGSNAHENSDDKTNLFGAMGHIQYPFGDPESIQPFVFGGGGIMWHQYSPDVGDSESEAQGVVNAGGGVHIPLGSVTGFVVGRYVHGFDDTTFFGVGAGIIVPVGADDEM